MKIISKTTRHHVYLDWLRSELYRAKEELTSPEISLIEKANPENDRDNRLREQLLFHKFGRSAILDKLPSEIEWFKTTIKQEDFKKLYILPVLDWFMDTGKTFKLEKVKTSLSSQRGHRLPKYSHLPDHHKIVGEIIKSMKPILGSIITVSTNTDGPYTIIDGTHRSSALYIQNKLQNTAAFLGIAKGLPGYIWSIERTDVSALIAELNQLENVGKIW